MPEDEHPLDSALGAVHEITIWLAMQGHHNIAAKLAEAHEEIQQYLVAKDL